MHCDDPLSCDPGDQPRATFEYNQYYSNLAIHRRIQGLGTRVAQLPIPVAKSIDVANPSCAVLRQMQVCKEGYAAELGQMALPLDPQTHRLTEAIRETSPAVAMAFWTSSLARNATWDH
jgi:hypothetical protein